VAGDVSRTAAVTGAASGIGRALATQLGNRGYSLRLADVDPAGLEAVSSELAAEFSLVTDVADASDVQAFADEIGAVDVLCLNAGVVGRSMGAPWEADPEEWDRVLGVNLHGVVNGLRSFVPLQLARGTPCQVLITASLAGAATWPGGGPYGVSKHAVLAVAEQAALELAATPVSVTVLCPGLVRTAMSDQGDDPLEVAAQGLRAMEEGRFAVLPQAWSSAVRNRAEILVSGRQPELPEVDG
jgi:NAD(P)-dependent dehydrogenase (short-subunit alcohol dehydrogenase family)